MTSDEKGSPRQGEVKRLKRSSGGSGGSGGNDVHDVLPNVRNVPRLNSTSDPHSPRTLRQLKMSFVCSGGKFLKSDWSLRLQCSVLVYFNHL